MHYTGDNPARTRLARHGDLRTILGIIAQADALGVRYKHPALTAAAEAAAKAAELRAEVSRQVGDARERAAAAGRAYLAGQATAAEVVEAAAATGPLLHPDVLADVRKIVNVSAATVEAGAARRVVEEVTEAHWHKPLAAAVAQAVTEAHRAADAVGITEPRQPVKGIRSADHPWAPTVHELTRTKVRHAWENLEDALVNLHELHDLADTLREAHLLPLVPGRDTREDYRWLHPHRLSGVPSLRREFWLENRHDAEPGIFTTEQMTEADTVGTPLPEDGARDMPEAAEVGATA